MMNKNLEDYKILVTILTCSKINFLKESYFSVKNQEISRLNYEVIIIVNTLSDNYYNEVLNTIKDCKIIRTQSNGFPGKGHNSCIEYFRNNIEYDYLIPIDGDDFLYPFFFKNMQNYINYPYNPDVLLLPFSDVITYNYPNTTLHIPLKYCYYSFNVESLDLMKSVTKKLSPFKYSLENINTPGRIILLSRKMLEVEINYQENLKWYDDLLIFLQIFEYNTLYPDKYKIFFVEDYYMHIYNSINDNSSTINFKKEEKRNYIVENINFQEEIKDKFLSIKNWDLNSIKILKNSKKHLLKSKINFVRELLPKLQVKELNLEYEKHIINLFSNFLIENKYENVYNIKEIENNYFEKK